ncbi:hypothetical protein TorRG33x02_043630 [Trema orientale]|uniref:Uncharacterized protein n=1 Tax=Trema orientale TaxID=63057 RepID=A0A2P5FQ72_TREOI|nr:hypothetical protein TorRG33x02_043630 [Trema orientale]
MCADPNDHTPFWVFNPLHVLLWVTERSEVNTLCQLDIIIGSVPDEDWLATCNMLPEGLLTPRTCMCGGYLGTTRRPLYLKEEKLVDSFSYTVLCYLSVAEVWGGVLLASSYAVAQFVGKLPKGCVRLLDHTYLNMRWSWEAGHS